MTIADIWIWVAALLAVSEALSLVPGIKSNGVFQLFWNILKAISGRK